MKKISAGLTLIEVLIASVLLFMSLGLVATGYQQYQLMQGKALRYLDSASDYDSIVSQIHFDLRAGKVEGKTDSGSYVWKAQELKRAKEIANIDAESGEFNGNIGMLVLFEVAVSYQGNSANEDAGAAFTYRQAVWLKNGD